MNNQVSPGPRTLRRILWAAIALIALAVGVMLSLHQTRPAPFVVQDQPPAGGHFMLTDQDGKTVRDGDFAGRYRLIYFGYTFCPDVCPVDVQNIAQGLALFKQRDPRLAAKVQPFFISVDPERDTPAVLKQYVAAFSPDLIGLTGTRAQIAAALRTFGPKGNGSYAKKGDPNPDGGYFMAHTRYKMLYGADGAGLAFLPEDGNAEQIADALAKWVK